MLVLQYAPALCDDQSCIITPNSTAWSIHGLWPENNDGSYPSDCTTEKFNPSAIAPVESEMNDHWFSISGPNAVFWAHEYEKHGVCAEDVLPKELAFFNATLNLRTQFDITPALAASGITPSATKSFTRKDFDAATLSAFGYNVLPACDKAGHLTGAVVCISKDLRAQSCGTVTYGTCTASSLFLIPVA